MVASIAFPLWYLGAGPSLSLQREYLALVPFAGMLAVATAKWPFRYEAPRTMLAEIGRAHV